MVVVAGKRLGSRLTQNEKCWQGMAFAGPLPVLSESLMYDAKIIVALG
jgi:hypothetical protein